MNKIIKFITIFTVVILTGCVYAGPTGVGWTYGNNQSYGGYNHHQHHGYARPMGGPYGGWQVCHSPYGCR